LKRFRDVGRFFLNPIDFGIRFEVILKIFIVVLFTCILIGGSVYKIIEKTLVAQEKKQAIAFIRSLEKSMNFSISSFIKDHVLKKNDSLWVFDADGQILWGSGQRPEKLTRKTELHVEKEGLFFPAFRRVVLRVVFLKKTGKRIIYYSHDIKHINNELSQFKKNILYVLLLSTVILVFLLNFMLKTTIITPFYRVIRNIRKIERGARKMLPEEAIREFKYLTNNFNRLLQVTYTQRESLEQKVTELEKLNNLLLEYNHEMEKFEKLAAIGELSAGVAHEIGNPLNNIIGYIELLKYKVEIHDDPELIDYVTRMNNDANRINTIIKNLLDYSRKDEKINLQKVNVNEIIDSSIELIELKVKNSNIVVRKEAVDEKLTVNADIGKLRQIMLNLLLNAVDSLEGRGEVIVAAEKTLSKKSVEKGPAAEIKYDRYFVELSISDNGSGIDEALMGRVFNPFFTTKRPGRGTGLGLSVSLRFAQEMGGTLTLRSREGKGTIATVSLPMSGEVL
jgi:signal transduction histidine kinase